jgi:hypothetical protein
MLLYDKIASTSAVADLEREVVKVMGYQSPKTFTLKFEALYNYPKY